MKLQIFLTVTTVQASSCNIAVFFLPLCLAWHTR